MTSVSAHLPTNLFDADAVTLTRDRRNQTEQLAALNTDLFHMSRKNNIFGIV